MMVDDFLDRFREAYVARRVAEDIEERGLALDSLVFAGEQRRQAAEILTLLSHEFRTVPDPNAETKRMARRLAERAAEERLHAYLDENRSWTMMSDARLIRMGENGKIAQRRLTHGPT